VGDNDREDSGVSASEWEPSDKPNELRMVSLQLKGTIKVQDGEQHTVQHEQNPVSDWTVVQEHQQRHSVDQKKHQTHTWRCMISGIIWNLEHYEIDNPILTVIFIYLKSSLLKGKFQINFKPVNQELNSFFCQKLEFSFEFKLFL
jgi:hypothetical protein